MTRALLRLAALCACAAALAGCISLLPKSKPSQLYRFGPMPAAAQTPAAASPPGNAHTTTAVFRTNGTFQGESSDDRMLTITGGKAAYIAESRWVAPAAVLFDEAVSEAFDASPIRLIARGQQGRSAYALRLDVRNFEARYDAGQDAAPTIVVRVRAALNKADQTLVGEQIFEASERAGGNRVGEIVAAYNKALGEVLGKIVSWTQANAV